MRTAAEISSLTTTASLMYSYRWDQAYQLKQRGVPATVADAAQVSNIISAIQNPSLNLRQLNALADGLVRLGYSEAPPADVFTQEGFTVNDFDVI